MQQHLKKVTEQKNDDVEAWIDLAQILERSDVQVSVVGQKINKEIWELHSSSMLQVFSHS